MALRASHKAVHRVLLKLPLSSSSVPWNEGLGHTHLWMLSLASSCFVELRDCKLWPADPPGWLCIIWPEQSLTNVEFDQMFYIDICICEWRDSTLKFAFLVSLEKLGALTTSGSLLSWQRSARAEELLPFIFDLVGSLSHEVSMVPYSSLSIICLARLGIWFNWTGAHWNKYPVISLIFNYWTQRCSMESVNGFSSCSSPVDDFHMCTTLSRVPSGLF